MDYVLTLQKRQDISILCRARFMHGNGIFLHGIQKFFCALGVSPSWVLRMGILRH